MRRNTLRRKNTRLCFDSLFACTQIALNAQIYQDKDYWEQAPSPFFIFIMLQMWLLFLTIRIPMLRFPNTCIERSLLVNVIALLCNTVGGTYWFIHLNKKHSDFLTRPYYVEALILLAIPIAVASFVIFIFMVVVCVFYFEHRRNPRMRLQEEPDEEQTEVIVETYMQMLEPYVFDQKVSKYTDCAICLKEFEDGEELKMIPNCTHIFHEACLRKQFVYLQICPMCRGNIIRMPNHGAQNLANPAPVADHQQQLAIMRDIENANQQRQQREENYRDERFASNDNAQRIEVNMSENQSSLGIVNRDSQEHQIEQIEEEKQEEVYEHHHDLV